MIERGASASAAVFDRTNGVAAATQNAGCVLVSTRLPCLFVANDEPAAGEATVIFFIVPTRMVCVMFFLLGEGSIDRS